MGWLLPAASQGKTRKSATSSTSFQSALYRALRQRTMRTDLSSLLRQRLQRWAPLLDTPIGIAARRGEIVIEKLKKEVPTCVPAALVRSWFNGWCTARRFQQWRSRCWLAEECAGEDSLEHYCRCAWSWSGARSRLRVDDSRRQLGRFLLLEALPQDELVLLALNLYAVYTARNCFRARDRRRAGKEATQKIFSAYTQACVLCPRLARRLRRLSSSGVFQI